MGCAAGHGSNRWERPPKYLLRDRDQAYGDAFMSRIRAMGIRDRPTAARSPLAERILRAGDRFDPTGLFGPRDCLGRAPSSPSAALLCKLTIGAEPTCP